MALFAAADPAASVVVVALIGVVTLTVRTRRFAKRHDTTELERALFMTRAAHAVADSSIGTHQDQASVDLTESQADAVSPGDTTSVDLRVEVDVRDEVDVREEVDVRDSFDHQRAGTEHDPED